MPPAAVYKMAGRDPTCHHHHPLLLLLLLTPLSLSRHCCTLLADRRPSALCVLSVDHGAAGVRRGGAERAGGHPVAVHLAGGREPDPGRRRGAARPAHRHRRHALRRRRCGGRGDAPRRRGLRAARLLPGRQPRHRRPAAGRRAPLRRQLLHHAPPGEAARAAPPRRVLRLRQQLHRPVRVQAALEGDPLLPVLPLRPRPRRRLHRRHPRRGPPPSRGGVRAVLLGDEPAVAGDHGGARGEPGRRARALPALLRGQRVHHAAQLLPSLPAAAGDAGHGPALRPDVADHPAPGQRRRAAGAHGGPVAVHPAAGRRLRGQHRGHLHGALQRAVQELPPPGGGEQPRAAQVAGLLPLPGDGQGGGAAGDAGGRRQPARLPGLHVAVAARLHAEALPGGHEDAGGVLVVDRRAARQDMSGP